MLKAISKCAVYVLVIPQLLSCSRTINHHDLMGSFRIDTTRYEDGSVMTITPRHGKDIFGTMIDIGDTTYNKNSLILISGISGIETTAVFMYGKTKRLYCRIDDENYVVLFFYGKEGELTSSSVTRSNDNIKYHYDEFSHTNRLLSIVSEKQDTTIIQLDRGDDLLHLDLNFRKDFAELEQDKCGDDTMVKKKEMERQPQFDDCCRIDTCYYPSGKIKSLSQMAGARKNGIFIKFHHSGCPAKMSTYLDGKLEGPYCSFDSEGHPTLIGYRSGNVWVGTVVEFQGKGTPKNVIIKTDSLKTMVFSYDENGEFLGQTNPRIFKRRMLSPSEHRGTFLDNTPL